MPELDAIIGNPHPFLDAIIAEIEQEGYDMADFVQIDHMCYRTTSLAQYDQKRRELATVATLLSENIINNRPIASFKLNEPFMHNTWRIDVIELPAPKPGSDYDAGLEHIEVVLYDDFDTFLKKYPRSDYARKAAKRVLNPDISLRLKTYTVKFHIISLSAATYLENAFDIRVINDQQINP